MILSIITINRNNSSGLDRTLSSVAAQTYKGFEYIVVDGASTDGSVDIIKKHEFWSGIRPKWVSEPDSGIYNAMNKGLGMATGDYVQFLNSGDCFADDGVVQKIVSALEEKNYPSILYGNMIKEMTNGSMMLDKGFAGKDINMLGMFTGTLNHSPAYIKRDLFDKYDLYDESLKIVSDWKWFLRAIVLGGEIPQYVDVDVTRFDMTGISETNKELNNAERRRVLEELFPKAILKDYDQYSFAMEQFDRLKRHPWAYKLVWFLERCLFKIEKLK